MFEDKDIILLSHSPRRIELLKKMGLSFRVAPVEVVEYYPEDLIPEEIPVYLSKIKAENAPVEVKENTVLIAADTVVYAKGRILGKPASAQKAFEMLKLLSGDTHYVITGVTICGQGKSISFSEKTSVTFHDLSDEEIHYYIDKEKPFDKAGSYGIQEWIGVVGIKGIEGSFYNVMGLPTDKLFFNLKRL